MSAAALLLAVLSGAAPDGGDRPGVGDSVEVNLASDAGAARPAAAGATKDDAEVAAALRLARAVVVIRDTAVKGHGTGFLVDLSGLVVTNAHVTKQLHRPEAVLNDGTVTQVLAVLAEDEAHDVAIVRIVPVGGMVPLPVAAAVPALGLRVFSMGSPAGYDFTFASGRVSAFRPDGVPKDHRDGSAWEATPKLQLDITSTHGASGSPVIDETGTVVGIIQSGLDETSGFVLAVPGKDVLDLVRATAASTPGRTFDANLRSFWNLGFSAIALVLAVAAWLFIAGGWRVLR